MTAVKKGYKILITGGAGFIGYHLTRYILLNHPEVEVTTLDSMNSYYDIQLKKDRLVELDNLGSTKYRYIEADISDKINLEKLFQDNSFSVVINLAAQAGVRYARENPGSYIKSNIDGFYSVAECSAKYGIDVLIYASSSSVYGANSKIPFEETDNCSSPMSLYAATKLSNENLAASYYYSHGLSSVGLRFFNVYGPWGRPDMAYYKWSKNLIKGEPIELRDMGEMYRDMTYIDDVVVVIDRLFTHKDRSNFKHEIFNVGNEDPVKISDMLEYIQKSLSEYKAKIVNVSKGSEEPYKTFAKTDHLKGLIGFVPGTPYTKGLDSFMSWFKSYYDVR